jgi:TetR/AcrR family transcriptional regulator, transcriptional repressor for nem operon
LTNQYKINIFAFQIKKMAGRPKIFDEQIALQNATNLFWEKGFDATSTDDLIRTMGLQRGSFYHSFGSKKELFINAFTRYEALSFEELKRQLKATKKPMNVIKSIFHDLIKCSLEEHNKGCFAGNTITALSNIDAELTEIANSHIRKMENIFYEQIKASQQTGELTTKTDARLLSLSLINLWNGINITRKVYTSKKDLKALVDFQLAVLV